MAVELQLNISLGIYVLPNTKRSCKHRAFMQKEVTLILSSALLSIPEQCIDQMKTSKNVNPLVIRGGGKSVVVEMEYGKGDQNQVNPKIWKSRNWIPETGHPASGIWNLESEI